MTFFNFYSLISASLRKEEDKVFIRWGNIHLTGKTISSGVAQFRQEFKGRIAAGDSVLILRSLDTNTFLAVLAVMAHGAIPVLPPGGLSKRKLFGILRKSRPGWAITQSNISVINKCILRLFGLKVITVNTDPVALEGNEDQPKDVPSHQPALITYSSGSTGNSKTIARSHAVLQAQHSELKTAFPPFEGQVDFPLFPAVLLHNLAVGVTTVVPEIEGFAIGNLNVEKIIAQLSHSSIRTMTGNVYYFSRIIDQLVAKQLTFNSVKAIGVGGSPVPEHIYISLKQLFPQADVYCIYGSSEAEPIAIRKVNEYRDPALGYNVGKAVHGAKVMIDVTTSLNIQSTGRSYEAGEILISGKHVVLLPGHDWYRTGDFGYIDEVGELILTGRQGNQTVINGVQHYQIEHVVSQLPGVAKVAAIAKENFILYIVGSISKGEVQRKLDQYFPKACIGEIFFREALPVDNRHRSKIIYNKVT